jgi:hypothetical protein
MALLAISAGCSQPERPSQPDLQPVRQGQPKTEGDLRYSAETLVMESFPVQLATTVTVANIGSRPAALEFSDGCPVLLRAYRAPDHTGEPAWDQARETFCTMAIQRMTISPGESRDFTVRTDARQILGDSLPNGRYLLTAVLRKTGWPLELDAGSVDLAQ